MNTELCHINLAKGFRGGERQTFLLVRALSQKIRQTVIVRNCSKLSDHLRTVSGVDIIEIGKPFILNLKKFKNFNLIHAHEAKAAHLAFFSHMRYKIPYIITRRVLKKPKNIYFFRKVHARAFRVVAISNQVKHNLEAVDQRIQTEVIFSSFSKLPVNPIEVGKLKNQYKHKFLIGHVGALVNTDKGQIHIINVAKKLYQDHPDIHFLFLGDGRDKSLFIQHAKGYDNVEFVGFKSNIGDYYSIFNLFLFPSLDEGLGSAVLDAFDFGLPVIATHVGGIPEIITPNKNGILIQPKDEIELYKNIVTLYKNSHFRKILGQNAKQSLQRFTIENATSQYLALYQKILNTKMHS